MLRLRRASSSGEAGRSRRGVTFTGTVGSSQRSLPPDRPATLAWPSSTGRSPLAFGESEAGRPASLDYRRRLIPRRGLRASATLRNPRGTPIHRLEFSRPPAREVLSGTHGRHRTSILPQSRRLPVCVSCPYERSRVHPAYRPGAVHGVVYAQSRVERLPGDPGEDV